MKRHRARTVIIITALALLCVAGAELAACSHFAPQLYQRITAPVVQGCRQAARLGRRVLDSVSQLADQTAARLAEAVRPEESAPTQTVETPPSLPAEDPAVTALEQSGDQELLTGGILPVVYFNQRDPLWADLPYGSDTVGGWGCGPTTMAMVVETLTDIPCDPGTMARWAYEHHHWASTDGSYLSLVPDCAEAFGLTAETVEDKTPEALENALYAGKLLVALMGPGHFTESGHFILIRGFTLEGRLLVADPNSRENSLESWDPQLLLDELSHKATDGGPLWAIASPT